MSWLEPVGEPETVIDDAGYLMSDPTEMVLAVSYGECQAALRIPVRADGALPYLLSEVVTEGIRLFLGMWNAVRDYEDLDDVINSDDDEATPR